MQKKLLSLAIASALALPGAAMADLKNVDIYGKFHASWDFVDNKAIGDDSDDNTAVFRNSRLGFKGSEKLSDEMKAIWQIETGLDTVGSTSTTGAAGAQYSKGDRLFMRNTFIGLSHDRWGSIKLGKHDTPYKISTAKMDIFSDTIADYNNIIGAHITSSTTGAVGSNFNEREPQLVMYEMPELVDGLKASIARESWQDDEVRNGVVGDNGSTEGWSVMGMYDKGPFFASLAYELFSGDGNNGAEGTNDVDAWKIGFGYKFNNNNTKVNVIYEDIEKEGTVANSSSGSRDAYGINLAHDIGKNTIKFAYMRANDSEAADSKDGAENWSLGVDHNFSKRSKIYAIFTQMNNDSNANYGLYGGQGRGATDTGTSANTTTSGFYTNGDVKAMSLGIIHSF